MDDAEGKEKLEIMSKNQHRITMDDTAGEEKLEIISKNEHRITMDDKENVVKIGTAKGVMASLSDKGKIELNTKNATIILDEMMNMVTIKSPGDILVEAAGNLDLKAQGNLNLQASNTMSVRGNTLVEIKGALIKLN